MGFSFPGVCIAIFDRAGRLFSKSDFRLFSVMLILSAEKKKSIGRPLIFWGIFPISREKIPNCEKGCGRKGSRPQDGGDYGT